jgi:dTDP-glucose pyrophosphorylase
VSQAYLSRVVLDGSPSALVLDNIFFGHGLPEILPCECTPGAAMVFGYQVTDP